MIAPSSQISSSPKGSECLLIKNKSIRGKKEYETTFDRMSSARRQNTSVIIPPDLNLLALRDALMTSDDQNDNIDEVESDYEEEEEEKYSVEESKEESSFQD